MIVSMLQNLVLGQFLIGTILKKIIFFEIIPPFLRLILLRATKTNINREGKTMEAMRHSGMIIKGGKQPPYEVETYHKEGSTRLLVITEVPIFDKQGNMIAVEGIAQNITDN